ncbi:hypothetical protein [Streptomyces canus]
MKLSRDDLKERLYGKDGEWTSGWLFFAFYFLWLLAVVLMVVFI